MSMLTLHASVLYRFLSAGEVALGIVHVSATATLYDGLTTRALWFASGGVMIALTGAMNLLRQAYGQSAPGVRRVAIAANIVLVIFTALNGIASHASAGAWAMVAVLGGAPAMLCLVPSAQRPAISAPQGT